MFDEKNPLLIKKCMVIRWKWPVQAVNLQSNTSTISHDKGRKYHDKLM